MKSTAFLLIGSFILLCFTSKADTVKVCPTCKVSTLNEAVDKANRYDTLLVSEGTYTVVDLIIDKPLVLLGKNNPVFDGEEKGYILVIQSDSVSIKGFTLIGCGRSYTKDFAAIHVDRSDYFLITNNIIRDPFFGILAEKSHYGKIIGNEVTGHSMREDDSGNGIHLWHCSNMVVRDNNTSHLRDGIYFEFVTDSKVINNVSHENVRYGLHFMFSDHDEYIGNQFINNGAGVAVMFSKFIVMRDNQFVKNWGTASYGLLLKEIYDAEVVHNIFLENTIAIFVEGSTRVNYLSNDFTRNGWAVKISGGCYANLFSTNNFIGNSFDVSYNTKLNDNSFDANYWSEYSGYDLDKDGIGDVPYRPVKLFSYMVNQTPETIVLLRSLFVDILNFSEKVSPIFTPDDLVDQSPSMQTID